MKRILLKSSLLLLALSGCVTIHNYELCHLQGFLSKCIASGEVCGSCAETQTSNVRSMTFPQLLDFIEAQPERPDPDHPGQNLPQHGAAIMISAENYTKLKTDLEEACRQLGTFCSPEIKQLIVAMQKYAE